MSDNKIKNFGTASYDIQGAVCMMTRVKEGMSYQEVLEIASECLSHTPKSHMKAIRGSIISALIKFEESRFVRKDPLIRFINQVEDPKARKEAIFYHILKHNYTLFKICEELRNKFSDTNINRKEMVSFIFKHTKSDKGSQYTIQKAFRILKNYEYITRSQPDNLIITDPTPEGFGYVLFRHLGAGENPAPTIDEILRDPYISSCFFTEEGIMNVIDEKENLWWYREKTSKSDSITLRFYDAMEFVAKMNE
jgi:hypothetical protein